MTKRGKKHATSQTTADKRVETRGNAKGALTERPRRKNVHNNPRDADKGAEMKGAAKRALTERPKEVKRAQRDKGRPISV